MSHLENDLTQLLMHKGASLVGFADISLLPNEPREYMDCAVWIAVALDPNVVGDITEGPTKFYEIEYRKKNELLKELCIEAVKVLRGWGFEATHRAPTDENIDWIDLTTPMPHKTVATRAGMGWIGKCGLLVTKEYGSAIRMAVVLTDATLEGEEVPIGASYCGDCMACVKRCPANAPTGKDWIKGLDREEYYDAFACHEHILQVTKKRGLQSKICGICIAVCPYTMKYLKRTSSPQ